MQLCVESNRVWKYKAVSVGEKIAKGCVGGYSGETAECGAKRHTESVESIKS